MEISKKGIFGSTLVVPGFLVLLAAIMVIAGTRWGIGVGPDSTAYLGFQPHDSGLAPLYSWAILAIRQLVPNVLEAARWFNIMLLGGTIVTVWYVLYRATNSVAASFLGPYLILTSSQGLNLYLSALSEPLFIFLAFLGLVFLSRYLESSVPRFLLAASVAVALAGLARYAGVALIATGAVSIILLGQSTIRSRIRDASIFAGIAVVPTALWLVYVKLVYGTAGGREAALAGNADLERYLSGVKALARLLLPTAVPVSIRLTTLLVAGMGLVVLATMYARKREKTLPARAQKGWFEILPLVLGLFILFYLALLIVSVLIEPYLPLTGRYMFPIYVAAVPMALILVYKVVFPKHKSRTVYILFAVCAVGLAMSNSARALHTVAQAYNDGKGFSSRSWKTSELIKRVRRLDPCVPIYTNGHDAIAYLTGKQARKIPKKFFRRSGRTNSVYLDQLEAMRNDLQHNNGVLVYFDRITWRFYQPSEVELKDQLPLRVVTSTPDGTIYRLEE